MAVYYASLKRYGNKYKLSCLNVGNGLGGKRIITERGTANTQKLENNIIRAKNRITELTLCNSFDFFI